MTPRVYCDMDGVLANFEDGFYDVSGRRLRGFEPINGYEWKTLQKGWPTFWADLEYMDYALDLWRVLLPYHPILLTASPDGWPSAGVGKHIWAKRKLPKFGYQPGIAFISCRREEKQNYAKQSDGTPNVLIDDLARNIAEWSAAGGAGIVYIPSGGAPARVKQFIIRHMERYE